MTARHEEPHPHIKPRTTRLPRTIDAVADALTGAKRMAFYAEIGGAQAGEEINAVLRKWWMEATFDSVPGRERRLAQADAGTHLVPLPDLVDGRE